MAFAMVLPQRWLLHKPALVTIFGFCLMVSQMQCPPEDHERLIDEFFSAANSIAFNTLADDVVSKLFSGP